MLSYLIEDKKLPQCICHRQHYFTAVRESNNILAPRSDNPNVNLKYLTFFSKSIPFRLQVLRKMNTATQLSNSGFEHGCKVIDRHRCIYIFYAALVIDFSSFQWLPSGGSCLHFVGNALCSNMSAAITIHSEHNMASKPNRSKECPPLQNLDFLTRMTVPASIKMVWLERIMTLHRPACSPPC